MRFPRRIFGGFLVAAAVLPAVGPPPFARGEEASGPIAIRPLLEEHCFRCHGPEKQKGDLRLDGYSRGEEILRDRKVWLKVLDQLESREMPTEDPLPTEAEYAAMIEWVDRAVNDIDWEKIRHPGHVAIPRLTKAEYRRTVADLLGIDARAGDEFSEDGEGKSGFTNDREGLSVSASQMEKYFAAAERAIDALIALNAKPVKRRFESEAMFMTESGSVPQPFAGEAVGYALNRGQMTLYDSVEMEHDGVYRFRVRARSTAGPTGGKLRIDDVEAGDFDVPDGVPREYEFISFVARGSHQMAWNIKGFNRRQPATTLKKPSAYPQPPENAPQIITDESVKRSPTYPRPAKLEGNAESLLNMFDGRHRNVQRAYEWLRLVGPEGDPRELERFRNYVSDRLATVEEIAPKLAEALGIPVETLEKNFDEANVESLADRLRLLQMAEEHIVARPGSLAIDWIEIEGPIPPEDSEKAKRLAALFGPDRVGSGTRQGWVEELTLFARNAFRRPVSEGEMARYVDVCMAAAERGESHAEALKQAFVAVLVSPKFLYRVEQAPAGAGEEAFALGGWALASRLSYFLWLTMPDNHLFSDAESGRLTDPKVLAGQVDRLLNDEKAEAFFATFAGQWLGFESLGVSVFPDEAKFPRFTPELSAAMKAETRLWFESVFRENRSVLDLVEARETFLNAELARHYAIPGVKGEAMQRVALTDEKRGGILGMGSVLTATSTPVRTSPVVRGVWLMERVLGDDPGEPLPDAGALPGNAGEERGKTLREELEIHRDKPQCASCHDAIDPLGFGLEQFDAIGRYREREAGRPVDARGTLPDGTEFDGVVELKRYILEKRRDDFLRVLAERLLSFALGRELEYYDEAALRRIVETTREDGYRARTLVKEVVLSYPFRNQSPSPELILESAAKP
ncbi:MAG: DUF1592 domain-containing protein [Verrucomicrobiae bacterium]|nr:DUF1592 domain-containing protein [Verrucomicrobiae bacterium]MCP5540851.1 DUF1592 domain-containing protein [Akkermansiaceae bacterium]